MAITQEMFRFVTTRRPEQALRYRVDRRLVRDLRATHPGSLLVTLFAAGPFPPKVSAAEAYARGSGFVAADDPLVLALEPAADYFRRELVPGAVLADLQAAFQAEQPALAALLATRPSANVLQATVEFIGRLWDSTYTLVTLGFDRYVSTQYCADALRVYQVLRLWWLHVAAGRETWTGGTFDEYELIIDLDAAQDPGSRTGTPAGTSAGTAGRDRAPGRPAALIAPGTGGPSVSVPLTVGGTMPPVVGDLLLVEQELRRYELGEMAETQTIMRGERREQTIRTLARTSQTTTTTTASEQEDTSSRSTDERFQLSAQAQETATESFGVEAGISVSGKFGPVQTAASVNASFSTSTSSTRSTAQEYAKTVTEEATKRVKTSFAQTTSVTVLTERQDTTLRGFNNEGGTEHVNGLYRWIDKIYSAQVLNYGRRLMFTAEVPEPSAFFLGRLQQIGSEVLDGIVAPIPLGRVNRATGDPLPADSTQTGFTSFLDVSDTNYAKLAALYGLPAEHPPAETITGVKAFVHPEAMDASKIDTHSDEDKELSYVGADNTLTVDPDYRLSEIGVFVPLGGTGGLRWWAESLKLGQGDDVNRLLVQVGNRGFHLSAAGQGGGDLTITTNFNEMQAINPSDELAGVLQQALPVTTVADFEGISSFSVLYTATRRTEAYEAWKARVYAAVTDGYDRLRQAYEQALAAAVAKVDGDTAEQTSALRDDQYRTIELTELKRGCIELFTEGTAAGHPSISVAEDGTPHIVFDEAEGATVPGWRAPLANGGVTQFFEQAWEWDQAVYTFHPYYWAGPARWRALTEATSTDPVFGSFLQAGSATVVVPVRPGYERPVVLFFRTGQLWRGGYLPLFTDQQVLDVYDDVERGVQIDPPEPVGEPWEIRLPTSMVMLQEDDVLPDFPPGADEGAGTGEAEVEPDGGTTPPF